MSDIKIGDYVRRKNGSIGQVIHIRNKTWKHDRTHYWVDWNIERAYAITDQNITKHSPNIIDLIEVGDYVNGEKMKEFYIEENPVTKNKRLVVKYEWLNVINDFEIKSIVTREQFEKIKYMVGEKE